MYEVNWSLNWKNMLLEICCTHVLWKVAFQIGAHPPKGGCSFQFGTHPTKGWLLNSGWRSSPKEWLLNSDWRSSPKGWLPLWCGCFLSGKELPLLWYSGVKEAEFSNESNNRTCTVKCTPVKCTPPTTTYVHKSIELKSFLSKSDVLWHRIVWTPYTNKSSTLQKLRSLSRKLPLAEKWDKSVPHTSFQFSQCA